MKKIFYLGFLLFGGLFLGEVVQAQDDPCTCNILKTISFQCVVGKCKQTISVGQCQGLTTGNCSNCLGCYYDTPCCGVAVCSDISFGECKGVTGEVKRSLAQLPASVRQRLFFRNCSGAFQSASTLRPSTSPTSPAPPAGN